MVVAPDLPPLPAAAGPPARSPQATAAAYEFAARHPEVLSYVPCFCGCRRQGHGAASDCFVAGRGRDGKVQWEAHGMG